MQCDNCLKEIATDLPLRQYPLVTLNGEEITTEATSVDKHAFQGENAFHMRIDGGYAEFIDGVVDVLMCHECGHALVAAFPFLAELLRGGHSHNTLSEMVDAVDWTFADADDLLKRWDGKSQRVAVVYGDGTHRLQ